MVCQRCLAITKAVNSAIMADLTDDELADAIIEANRAK